MDIIYKGNGIYKVRSQLIDDKWYYVTIKDGFPHCDCLAYAKSMICKHLKEVCTRIKDNNLGIEIENI